MAQRRRRPYPALSRWCKHSRSASGLTLIVSCQRRRQAPRGLRRGDRRGTRTRPHHGLGAGQPPGVAQLGRRSTGAVSPQPSRPRQPGGATPGPRCAVTARHAAAVRAVPAQGRPPGIPACARTARHAAAVRAVPARGRPPGTPACARTARHAAAVRDEWVKSVGGPRVQNRRQFELSGCWWP